MDKSLLVIIVFWGIGILCFFIGDLVKWFRRKDMAGVTGGNYAPGGVYSVSNGTGTTTMSTNPTGTKTTFNGRVYMREGAVVEDMDVGEGLRLLTFFLQSRHPEIFEEYQAIRKIEKS